MRNLMTVSGPVDPAQITGTVLAHEHLIVDLRTDTDRIGLIDDREAVLSELRECVELGLGLIVEQTCRGMGRDVVGLRELSEQSGLPIVAATGYYYEKFHPESEISDDIDAVAELLISDLEDGADGTTIQAGVIAEVGTSGSATASEKLSVRAAARAALATGRSVGTHAHLSTGAIEQFDLLTEEGLPPARIMIGHQDLAENADAIVPLAKAGAFVAFDTVGKNAYQPDETRLRLILDLLEAGFADRVILSNDISRNGYLLAHGGHGYRHVLTTFRDLLVDAGVDEVTLMMLYRDNALAWLCR